MNINFNPQFKNKEKTPIIISVTWKPNNRVQKSIRKSVETKYWDNKKQILKSSHPLALNYNSFLNDLRTEITKRVFDQVKVEEDLTEFVLSNIIDSILTNGIKQKSRKLSVVEVYDIFIRDYRIDGLKPRTKTLQAYITCRNKISDFERILNTKFYFNDINEDFYNKFIEYQFNLGNNKNTVGTNIRKLKTFIKWASEKKYHNNHEYKKFKVYRGEARFKISLNEQEIMRLKKLESKNQNIEFARLFMLVNIALGLRAFDLLDIISNREI